MKETKQTNMIIYLNEKYYMTTVISISLYFPKDSRQYLKIFVLDDEQSML
jgi:hypothetical protein